MRSDYVGSFLASVLDSMTQQVAVLDSRGVIQWVNRAWTVFCEENGGDISKTGRGASYLRACDNSAPGEVAECADALTGIMDVMTGKSQKYDREYPCDSPTERRWFVMRALPLDWQGPKGFIIEHHDITDRKRAQMRFEELAILDSLTGIANRRRFDEYLESEWLRARRLGHPVSLMLFDVDHFKKFNDNYGHVVGDECLRLLGETLRKFSRRPGDLVARYGGEEFAVIFSNTEQQAALKLAENIRLTIQALNITHEHATEAGCVTISVGVATLRPDVRADLTPADLIASADEALYQAKNSGRNRICAHSDPNVIRGPGHSSS